MTMMRSDITRKKQIPIQPNLTDMIKTRHFEGFLLDVLLRLSPSTTGNLRGLGAVIGMQFRSPLTVSYTASLAVINPCPTSIRDAAVSLNLALRSTLHHHPHYTSFPPHDIPHPMCHDDATSRAETITHPNSTTHDPPPDNYT
jgi:hypothetical protein